MIMKKKELDKWAFKYKTNILTGETIHQSIYEKPVVKDNRKLGRRSSKLEGVTYKKASTSLPIDIFNKLKILLCTIDHNQESFIREATEKHMKEYMENGTYINLFDLEKVFNDVVIFGDSFNITGLNHVTSVNIEGVLKKESTDIQSSHYYIKEMFNGDFTEVTIYLPLNYQWYIRIEGLNSSF